MCQCLLRHQPLVDVSDQEFLDQILRLHGDVLPARISKIIFSIQNRFLQALQCLCAEWRIAAHDDIEYDAASPDIAFLRIISFDDLWRHVVWCAEELRQLLMRLDLA
jgi:hypothetical protein